ncbi:uncharacterized protein LOC123564583 isoform X1 [Mercenaria mercenaria]|uniref:uncharacterized protein LOC123564583 isoform X1 n=1 Tax=Mercenaria mercenaria TaxID=6596 RepID=UPI00234E6867|nr:uncharacterized protein LOC123564583 isoform X1 [Mercenaria mercenaria]
MISSIHSTISPRDLTLLIPLSLFYFETGQSASLKPFQFQCYDNDICTWPQQYCSSKAHEHRCIPCLRSVCSLQSPPLQCLYNCSLIGQKENTTCAEIAYEKSGKYIFVLVVVGLCVAFSILVACLIAKIFKLKKAMTKKEKKGEEMQNLITSLKQEKKVSVKQKNDENKVPSQENDSCAKSRLTDVPPTRDSSSPGSYKPTTHLDKPPKPEHTHTSSHL